MTLTFLHHSKHSYHFHHPLLQSNKTWLKRVYHTSTAFQLSPTHIKVVVFGGCNDDPDGVKPENAPTCEPNTIVLDISKYISLMLLHQYLTVLDAYKMHMFTFFFYDAIFWFTIMLCHVFANEGKSFEYNSGLELIKHLIFVICDFSS